MSDGRPSSFAFVGWHHPGPVAVGRGGRPEVILYLYRCEELRRLYPLPYG